MSIVLSALGNRNSPNMVIEIFCCISAIYCFISGYGGSDYSAPSGYSGGDLSSTQIELDIGDIMLKVYKGDITEADAEVIVNSTNSEFDLSRGNNIDNKFLV